MESSSDGHDVNANGAHSTTPGSKQGPTEGSAANLTDFADHSTCSTMHFKYSVSGMAQWWGWSGGWVP